MKESIENKNSQNEEKQSSSIIDKTREWVSNTIDTKFIRRIEFLMKLEEIEWDVDDDTFRIIWDNSTQRLSPWTLRSFESTLNEYEDILDNEILKKLYYLGFSDFVLQHIDIQHLKLDKDFSVKLFIDWHIDLLSNCGGYYERKLVDWLIETGEYELVLNNIDKFKIENQYIVNRIIDQWWGDYICKDSKHINGIAIHQTAERMEKHGVKYKDIYSFIQRYKGYLDNATTD